jgi:hypothetical protein
MHARELAGEFAAPLSGYLVPFQVREFPAAAPQRSGRP